MNIKEGVNALGITGQALLAIIIAQQEYLRLGHNPTITSITDGTHMNASLHYAGNAVDLRLHDVEPAAHRDMLETRIRAALGYQYDVVRDAPNTPTDHIHIEWQPKRA